MRWAKKDQHYTLYHSHNAPTYVRLVSLSSFCSTFSLFFSLAHSRLYFLYFFLFCFCVSSHTSALVWHCSACSSAIHSIYLLMMQCGVMAPLLNHSNFAALLPFFVSPTFINTCLLIQIEKFQLLHYWCSGRGKNTLKLFCIGLLEDPPFQSKKLIWSVYSVSFSEHYFAFGFSICSGVAPLPFADYKSYLIKARMGHDRSKELDRSSSNEQRLWLTSGSIMYSACQYLSMDFLWRNMRTRKQRGDRKR